MNIAEKQRCRIRWMIRRDFAEALTIEQDGFGSPWVEENFIFWLRHRNCIAMVAEDEHEERIIGFMVYELFKDHLHVLNLGVAVSRRMEGVGRAMIDKLKHKLSSERRTRLVIEVNERNIDGQLFLKSCGLRAIEVLPDFYGDSDDAAYLMQYRYRKEDFA